MPDIVNIIITVFRRLPLQIIDYDALIKNAEYFKKILGSSKLCAVIKNDAYGHGLDRIARYLAPIADFFAVGSVYEAEQAARFKRDVLVLIPTAEEIEIVRAVESDVVLTVDSFTTLFAVNTSAEKAGRRVRVHIKIDSGMSRLGFLQKDLPNLINTLEKLPLIDAEGVYSHFWGADEQSCDSQLEYYLKCAETLENGLNKRLIKHIANTSAALLSDKYRLDMARVGLGLYGYGSDALRPVKTVTARVVAVKHVLRGEVVGYGGMFKCEKDVDIAVINAGYANGFARTLTSAYVRVNGRFCPVVAVCMAMIMADVSDVSIRVGDEVTLVGEGVNISNEKVIIYELLCNLH